MYSPASYFVNFYLDHESRKTDIFIYAYCTYVYTAGERVIASTQVGLVGVCGVAGKPSRHVKYKDDGSPATRDYFNVQSDSMFFPRSCHY